MADSILYVSDHPGHYDSIQAAVMDATHRVHVLTDRRASDENWPIDVTKKITVTGDGTRLETGGARAFHVHPGNERPPSVSIQGFTIVKGGIDFENVKFASVGCVDFRQPVGTGVSITGAANSNSITHCTVQASTSDGFFIGPKAHGTIIDGCRTIGAGRYGVFANGPAKVDVSGGQYEDSQEAGVKFRRCESPSITRAYIEGNGQTGSDAPVETIFADCDTGVVRDCYFQGLNRTQGAILSYGDSDFLQQGNSFRGYTGTVVST